MLALSGGTVWLATSPVWLVRSSEQIVVSDNRLLSDENIQKMVSVPYPQPLLKVQPEALAKDLMTHAPIESAEVTRRLIPPGLHVRVKERVPVAMTLPNVDQPLKTIPAQPMPFKQPGLVDAEGYWMPRNSFNELGANVSPPSLTVKGMQESYQANWRSLYKTLAASPVKVTHIDWTKPSNLILQSEFGEVHLGPYGKNFEAQLAALDQMRSLKTQVTPEKVAFIDLQNPEHPVVEILQANNGAASQGQDTPVIAPQ
jgi:cell division protein FtsQ